MSIKYNLTNSLLYTANLKKERLNSLNHVRFILLKPVNNSKATSPKLFCPCYIFTTYLIFFIISLNKTLKDIAHFLPVFRCLGDSAWNCIPTIYSVVWIILFTNHDFSAKGVVKGMFVCGLAPKTISKAEKSRVRHVSICFIKKY